MTEPVKFDPRDPEHLNAFMMLWAGHQFSRDIPVRQHPTLRFKLERPYVNVLEMMKDRVLVSLLGQDRVRKAAFDAAKINEADPVWVADKHKLT